MICTQQKFNKYLLSEYFSIDFSGFVLLIFFHSTKPKNKQKTPYWKIETFKLCFSLKEKSFFISQQNWLTLPQGKSTLLIRYLLCAGN